MKKYIIFYYSALGCDQVSIDAESLQDAIVTADTFSAKFGVLIIGICLESLLKSYCRE